MYVLDSTTIRRPYSFSENNTTQYAQHRTLNGSYRRDYFGANKRIWTLQFRNTNKTDYDIIRAIYDDYLDTNDPKTWEVTETNYTIASTDVHLDLIERGFSVRGTDYLSDFDLVLTEV